MPNSSRSSVFFKVGMVSLAQSMRDKRGLKLDEFEEDLQIFQFTFILIFEKAVDLKKLGLKMYKAERA